MFSLIQDGVGGIGYKPSSRKKERFGVTFSLDIVERSPVVEINRKLYWIDTHKKSIEICGSLMRLSSSSLDWHLVYLTVFGSYLYWAALKTKSLKKADKNTCSHPSRLGYFDGHYCEEGILFEM